MDWQKRILIASAAITSDTTGMNTVPTANKLRSHREQVMPSSTKVLGFNLSNLTLDETADWLLKQVAADKQVIREDLNAFKYYLTKKDSVVRELTRNADLLNADGASIVLAARLLTRQKLHRVTGVDLMAKLVSLASESGISVFLLGSSEETVSLLASQYGELHGTDIIAGYHNGYFKNSDERQICDLINASNAKILFVGTPSPMKENFVFRNKDTLTNIKLIMGVGGSFDVLSGKISRAPRWMQDHCLEWAYRLYKEPRRMWKRYLITNAHFIRSVMAEGLSLSICRLQDFAGRNQKT